MYNNKIIKITPQNKQDFNQIDWVLQNYKFYPNLESTPPLPNSFDPDFDYRQFLIYVSLTPEKDAFLVCLREQLDDIADFQDMVSDSDWTDKFNCSEIPTIEFYNDLQFTRTATFNPIFLHYDYNLFTNRF